MEIEEYLTKKDIIELRNMAIKSDSQDLVDKLELISQHMEI